MVTVKRAGTALFDRVFQAGEVVPPALWNQLPRYRQRILLETGRYEQTETEPAAGDSPAARPAPRKRKRKA